MKFNIGVACALYRSGLSHTHCVSNNGNVTILIRLSFAMKCFGYDGVFVRLKHTCRFQLFLCPHRRPVTPKKGLLFVILSVVFMKGGVIKESECFITHTHTHYTSADLFLMCVHVFS